MAARTRRQSKITILQPSDLKDKVAQAAAKRGMSVTSFINSTLERAADRTLSRVRRRTLTIRAQEALLKMLQNPKGPNKALREAARQYQERFGG